MNSAGTIYTTLGISCTCLVGRRRRDAMDGEKQAS